MKSLAFGLSVLVAVVLVSCKGSTSYTKYIDNKSDQELTVTIYGGDLYASQRVHTIPAGERKSIFIDVEDGAETALGDCLAYFDSLVVTYVPDSVATKIKKDPQLDVNWYASQSKQNAQKIHNYCTFTVSQTDL